MKRFVNIYKFAILVATLSAVALSGCKDEIDYPDGGDEGSPVTLTLDVTLPEMTHISRADMAAGLDGRVESLWVGIYNAASGERTGVYTESGNFSPTHENMRRISVNTRTGRSYIVAVANYAGRTAYDDNGPVDFATALANADSWEKFNRLSITFNTNGDINPDSPLNVLLMSGHYIGGTHANGDHTLIEPVQVPSSGTLPGAIHLRRLISQVRFNVTYNTDNIEDFEIVGWTVHNVPNHSWVYEQTQGTLNAGDLRTVGTKGSYQNTATTNIVEHNQNTYSFDWWQVENKRTGLEPPESHNKNGDYYSYREEEFKTAEGGLNTGKYKSLVSSADAADANNNATFVELQVRMTLKVDEKGDKISGARVVDGVYTVHLGYCEGSGKSKAQDFNCRRNSKYTYNVTINNVNDILVEARKEGEPTPGAEGMVSDVTEKYVELDAHYGVYNIQLTQSDLYPKEVNPESDRSFDYMIRCYDENNQPVDIDSRVPSSVTAADSKYINWVEIRRTTNATTLATYRPRTGTNADPDNPTMTIQEFWEAVRDKKITAGYFTVFFNEYVYETATDGNESGTPAWHDYVNKNNRTVWIRVLVDQSNDGESSYYNSKYAFSQRSIQTYYDVSATGSASALGMEHINESLGHNLRNTFNNASRGTDENNGRFNCAVYLGYLYSTRTTNANFSWVNNRYPWSNVIDDDAPQTSPAIRGQNVTEEARNDTNPYPVRALVTNTTGTSNAYDPAPASGRYLEAIRACMNRNRDLDGDGYIDANELRWYVPTTNIYTRMILGRRSLATPIMDYDANPQLNYGSTGKQNGEFTSLMLYGSNGMVTWAMEGVSTSFWRNVTDQNDGGFPRSTVGAPWQVRCVRNLGINLNTVAANNNANAAYRLRPGSTRVVEMIYYDRQSIRQEKLLSMVPHDVANQIYNRCYKAFEYSENEYRVDNANLTGGSTYFDSDNDSNNSDYTWVNWINNANPCAFLGSGWRIPNQKELAILNSLGIRPGSSNRFYLSGTMSHYDMSGQSANSLSDVVDSSRSFKIMCTQGNGNNTQRLFKTNIATVSYRRVRCVRDVD